MRVLIHDRAEIGVAKHAACSWRAPTKGVPACIGLIRCRLSHTVCASGKKTSATMVMMIGATRSTPRTASPLPAARRLPSRRREGDGRHCAIACSVGVGDVLHRLVDGDLVLGERC